MPHNPFTNKLHEGKTNRNNEILRLRVDEEWSLQMIGEKFGISRERIRQILGNSGPKYGGFRYGSTEPYKEIIINSLDKTNEQLVEATGLSIPSISRIRGNVRHAMKNNDGPTGKGDYSERLISKLLIEQGIDNELMGFRHPFDILALGFIRIDVKSSGRIHNNRMVNPQYSFHVGNHGKRNDADFYILLTLDIKEVFIVPSIVVSEKIMQLAFCWPDAPHRHRNCIDWRQYHNRWDLILDFKNQS